MTLNIAQDLQGGGAYESALGRLHDRLPTMQNTKRTPLLLRPHLLPEVISHVPPF